MRRHVLSIKTPWGHAYVERQPATHQGYLIRAAYVHGGMENDPKEEVHALPEDSMAAFRRLARATLDELLDRAPAVNPRRSVPEGRAILVLEEQDQ